MIGKIELVCKRGSKFGRVMSDKTGLFLFCP